mgnify:CR=1 FL=1
MKFCDRVRARREELNLSQDELAKRMGYKSRSSINKIELGLNDVSQSKIISLAKALETTIGYLMGDDDITPSNIYPVEGLVSFEEIGTVKAGFDGLADETPTGKIVEIPAAMLNGRPKEDFFMLRVNGDSMYPTLVDGDSILVQRCTSVDSGTLAVILYNGDEASVKKVHYVYGEDWMELVPINPEYKTKRIEGADLEQCRVLGKVVKLIREF